MRDGWVTRQRRMDGEQALAPPARGRAGLRPSHSARRPLGEMESHEKRNEYAKRLADDTREAGTRSQGNCSD